MEFFYTGTLCDRGVSSVGKFVKPNESTFQSRTYIFGIEVDRRCVCCMEFRTLGKRTSLDIRNLDSLCSEGLMCKDEMRLFETVVSHNDLSCKLGNMGHESFVSTQQREGSSHVRLFHRSC